MTDLDAIRARHHPVAGLRDDEGHLFEPATFCRHCVTLWPCDADALLAEVDRLRASVAALDEANTNQRGTIRAERARALPVIDTARALVMVASIHYQPTPRDWDILRAALAEYDR